MDFTDQRVSYEKGELHEEVLLNDPFELLTLWVSEAIEQKVPEPYAISLATCGSDSMPAVRTVLVREINDKGIVFYTNYLSEKGQDIDSETGNVHNEEGAYQGHRDGNYRDECCSPVPEEEEDYKHHKEEGDEDSILDFLD